MNGISEASYGVKGLFTASRVTNTSVHNGGIVTSTDIQKLTAIYLEQWDVSQSS